ncbi:MAG: hypothetical protein A2Y15_05790 [Clostridiales bacterium GWF2_36_10]|nr:MAG: hypothetical protein A2Y15_05790 [Clostridiales bacterium GWF2_36_10]HAN21945.1 single-stranded DNA-binding protein [Clostridiales bacterium]
MASFNKVILVGNLVADPELKQTANGVPVTSFRIAVSRKFTKQGETPQADFIDIVCWRQTAEFVTRYFNKGKSILVCGSLQTRNWVDNNNVKRYTTEVVADEVTFVEKKSNENSPRDNTPHDLPNYSSSGESSFEDLSADDELPF